MKKLLSPYLLVMLLVAICLSLSSCTLIGFGVGAAVDAQNQKKREIPQSAVQQIKPGTKIDLKQISQEWWITGKYLGLKTLSDEEYEKKIAAYLGQLPDRVKLPTPGAVVTIWDENDKQFTGEFVGFENHSLLVRDIEMNKRHRIIVDVFQKISTPDGEVILEKDALTLLMMAGKIPYRSQIKLDSGNGRSLIDTDQVSQIRVSGKKNGKVIGAFVGLAVDLAFIGWSIYFANEFDDGIFKTK